MHRKDESLVVQIFQWSYVWNLERCYQNVEHLLTEDYSSADRTPTASEVFLPGTGM